MKIISAIAILLSGCLFKTEFNNGIQNGAYLSGGPLEIYSSAQIIKFHGNGYLLYHFRTREYYRYVNINGNSVGILDTLKIVALSNGKYHLDKDTLFLEELGYGLDTFSIHEEIYIRNISINKTEYFDYKFKMKIEWFNNNDKLKLSNFNNGTTDEEFYIVRNFLRRPLGIFEWPWFFYEFNKIDENKTSI